MQKNTIITCKLENSNSYHLINVDSNSTIISLADSFNCRFMISMLFYLFLIIIFLFYYKINYIIYTS